LLGISGGAFFVLLVSLSVTRTRAGNFIKKVKKTAVYGLVEIQWGGLWKTRVKRDSGRKTPVYENVKA
jgi:hypothetical protein